MGIKISWSNDEKTLMLHEYQGVWTLEDMVAHIDETHEIIDTIQHEQEIDIIADVRLSSRPPKNLVSIVRYYREKRHPRQGIQVIVGTAFIFSIIKMITNVSSRLIPQAGQVHFVDNLEEAYAYLVNYRQAKSE